VGRALQRAWLGRGPLALALLPVSWLYGTLGALRRGAYRIGLAHSERLPVPVVVIGNVIAGGAGKTPAVLEIARHLRSRGIACGIVSRGYGRRTSDTREVDADSLARDVGDEPLLLAHSGVGPVFVARRRADAGRALLAAYPRTRVILCDDGLQHFALQRDIEVCVFDERGFGNGWLLPAGPLRERWPRHVDFVLLSSSNGVGIHGHRIERSLASHAVRADGTEIALDGLRETPFTALAGIAKPQAFFTMLHAAGLKPGATLALPDHHAFSHDPAPGAAIVCTEKDAVKLWRLRPDAWAVPLEARIEPAFFTAFDARLDAKLSSAR
jgi:tetraacyldisaccharide 4'-kinase